MGPKSLNLFCDPRYLQAVPWFHNCSKKIFNSTFHCFVVCLFVCFWKSITFTICIVIRKYLPICFLTVWRNWWFEAWTDEPDPYVWDQPLRSDGHLLQIRRPKLPRWIAAITIRSLDGHICQYTTMTQLAIWLTVLLPIGRESPVLWPRGVRVNGRSPRGWDQEVCG